MGKHLPFLLLLLVALIVINLVFAVQILTISDFSKIFLGKNAANKISFTSEVAGYKLAFGNIDSIENILDDNKYDSVEVGLTEKSVYLFRVTNKGEVFGAYDRNENPDINSLTILINLPQKTLSESANADRMVSFLFLNGFFGGKNTPGSDRKVLDAQIFAILDEVETSGGKYPIVVVKI